MDDAGRRRRERQRAGDSERRATDGPAGAMNIAWLDGALVDPADAGVALDDHGLTTGDGCFETMKVVDGTAFALTRHLARLDRSCRGLGLRPPSHERVRHAVDAVLGAAGPGAGRVRITVTAGRAPMGSGRGDVTPTLAVLVAGPPSWEPTTAVAVCPWVRNERSPVAGLKTTSYAENVVALAWAHERGCSEAILANTRGELCEGTGTNVFVVAGGTLATPPLESGCLAGVTRELLLEVAELDVEVRPVAMDELDDAAEVFLTSSTRDVHPVHAFDGRPLPAPGPVTAGVQRAFAALQARSLDP
jgi:branched-chain amino acid aminotransferase